MGRSKRPKKRGHPLALLFGFSEDRAVGWRIFQEQIKPFQTLILGRKLKNATDKHLYAFFESLVDLIRPEIRDGLASLVLSAPPKNKFPKLMMVHLKEHHQWLFKNNTNHTLSIGMLEAAAENIDDIKSLSNMDEFYKCVLDTTSKEADNLIEILEVFLTREDTCILYTAQEIEMLIVSKNKNREYWADYILITTKYFEESTPQMKHLLNRIIQVAQNKKVKTKVIESESNAGQRLDQLGGLVCIRKEYLKYQHS